MLELAAPLILLLVTQPEATPPAGDQPEAPALSAEGEKAAPAGEAGSPAPAVAPAVAPAGSAEPAEAAEAEDKELAVRADDFFSFSDYVDTRVTFAFSNNNVFAGPGDRVYQTSGYRIGVDPNLNLFLENVNTRFSGFETLSQLVLYKKFPGFWKRWETEAALAGRLAANTDTSEIRFYDAGTYLRVIYKLAEGDESKVGSVDLTAWPVSADRFRLGYTYLISWGGTSIFPGKLASSLVEGAVPGLRVRWRAPKGTSYAFAGFKSALILSRDPNQTAGEQVPQYGMLLGAGTTLADHVILETNGGYFQKGTQETLGLEGRRLHAFGASARVTFFEGDPPANSADYKLLRNDATTPESNYLWKAYRPGTGYSVAIEGTVLAQNLGDPDQFGSEKLVPAVAGGLVGQAKLDEWTLRVDAFLQSIDFILFDVPGFVPFQATFSGAKTTPEFFAALTAEYFFADYNFKPSLALGMKLAATYTGVVPAAQGPVVGGAGPGEVRTQIVADNRTRVVLPPDKDATPIFGVVLKLPLGLSEGTVISAEMRMEMNDNQVRIAQDNERGEVTYFFDQPVRLSIAAVLQSRW